MTDKDLSDGLGVNRQGFRVIHVDKVPQHFAVWEPMLGAVAGRFLSEASANAFCDRLNNGETPNFNPRGILDI